MHFSLSPFVVLVALSSTSIGGSLADNGFNANYKPYRMSPTEETTTAGNYHNSNICMDIRPQHSVNINAILGTWYANEIIMHTHDIPGIYEYDSCVIVQLSDFTEHMRQYDLHERTYGSSQSSSDDTVLQQQPKFVYTKYLRLLWSEKDDNLEYTFNYTVNRPGLWHNVGEQRGSFVNQNQYVQFAGSVQVGKAVNDHLVLTFCGSDITSSIYTIVLSREMNSLTREDLRSIRSLLNRRNLSTDSIRKVCGSSAAAVKSSLIVSLIMAIVYMLSK